MYKFFDSVRCEKSKWPPLKLGIKRKMLNTTCILLQVTLGKHFDATA